MIVLGAGASFTSQNARGDRIKVGEALAAAISAKAGIEYNKESLVEVLGAVRGSILSDPVLYSILSQEYKGCEPSKELEDIFKYTWKRLYTWNIDDTVENSKGRCVQTRRFYNGLRDKAVEFEGPNVLHIIHLHGEVVRPEHGFILTEQEYAEHIKSERHFWYQRLAQDYLSTCPVFIGSRLAEPILMAEIERAKKDGKVVSGKSFLITPDKLSIIQTANLKAKGIVHIRATLEDFIVWLKKNIPGGWSPKDIVSSSNNFRPNYLDGITFDEVQAVHSVRPINIREIKDNFLKLGRSEQERRARNFLEGFQPSWLIALSDVPVWLDSTDQLYRSFEVSVNNNVKFFIVTGQAGSGKSTAVMSVISKYSEINKIDLYELKADVKNVTKALTLLKRIHSKKIIVYIGDLFIYGDNFRNYIESISGENFIIVSTARSGEWGEHFVRYLGDIATPFQFQRFVRKDFEPLIERLVKYVPSPKFRQATKQAQIAKLSNSKNQLLIALREATQSERFDEIITSEFEGLPDDDTRRLFIIIGISTLARVGINITTAKEAYHHVAEKRSFEQAMSPLDGIVSETETGRLVARHDLYVRHILDSVTNFDEIIKAVTSILKTYRKFDIPVIKSVARTDYTLFKYVTNHSFVMSVSRNHGVIKRGAEVYRDFEVDFQLDGHFWLQYGLYMADINRLDAAVSMLKKSIEAYSANEFAIHALADIELRVAKERESFDPATRSLINDAVKSLTLQDAKSQITTDQYPIVTLVNGHLGALIKHGQKEAAREAAVRYFDRIKQLEKETDSSALRSAKERLIKFTTFGEWFEKSTRRDGKHKPARRGSRPDTQHKINAVPQSKQRLAPNNNAQNVAQVSAKNSNTEVDGSKSKKGRRRKHNRNRVDV